MEKLAGARWREMLGAGRLGEESLQALRGMTRDAAPQLARVPSKAQLRLHPELTPQPASAPYTVRDRLLQRQGQITAPLAPPQVALHGTPESIAREAAGIERGSDGIRRQHGFLESQVALPDHKAAMQPERSLLGMQRAAKAQGIQVTVPAGVDALGLHQSALPLQVSGAKPHIYYGGESILQPGKAAPAEHALVRRHEMDEGRATLHNAAQAPNASLAETSARFGYASHASPFVTMEEARHANMLGLTHGMAQVRAANPATKAQWTPGILDRLKDSTLGRVPFPNTEIGAMAHAQQVPSGTGLLAQRRDRAQLRQRLLPMGAPQPAPQLPKNPEQWSEHFSRLSERRAAEAPLVQAGPTEVYGKQWSPDPRERARRSQRMLDYSHASQLGDEYRGHVDRFVQRAQ